MLVSRVHQPLVNFITNTKRIMFYTQVCDDLEFFFFIHLKEKNEKRKKKFTMLLKWQKSRTPLSWGHPIQYGFIKQFQKGLSCLWHWLTYVFRAGWREKNWFSYQCSERCGRNYPAVIILCHSTGWIRSRCTQSCEREAYQPWHPTGSKIILPAHSFDKSLPMSCQIQ